MEALKVKFPELTFIPLQSPALHPLYEYDPFNPSTRTLRAGHQKHVGRRKFDVDTLFEKDVAVEMRDGAKLYTDVFRPVTSDGDEKVPAVIAWSPYGKSGGMGILDYISCQSIANSYIRSAYIRDNGAISMRYTTGDDIWLREVRGTGSS